MIEFFANLFQNRIFMAATAGWFVAQVTKTIIHAILNKEFRPDRLVGAGGMPSSHTATVCALVVTTYAEYGSASFQFAIAALFAIIVIHDARGVRYETSKQAVILNKILEDFADLFSERNPEHVMPKLKELVGHTPLQVLMGGIIGITVGVIYVLIFY